MTRKLFGTDGIRGRSNTEPMTAQTALAVAMATGDRFRRGNHRHVAVIGKDTRLSGYMIEQAMTAGFVSMGMDVLISGPLPTPAVAMLTRSMRADVGVVISASHNPFEDNGIKLFGPDGFKLSDAVESEIEALVENGISERLAPSEKIGQVRRIDDAIGRYIEFVKSTFPRQLRLDGLRAVVDCAHGAAYRVAPTVLRELGADVVAMGVEPNGTNINQNSGATSPKLMQQRVVEVGADLGIALDGDADRLILCDETGRLIDGDQIMALIATAWRQSGQLTRNGVVATVMSNLGLERYLKGLDLDLARTKVGDRYVVEHMRAHGFNLGGEQSGHVVLGDYSTTGDGLIAALQVLACIRSADRPASEVLYLFDALPQVLKNVRYEGPSPLDAPNVQKAIADAESRLAPNGRLLVRKSGTEPLIRVMAEGEDVGLIDTVAAELCDSIKAGSARHGAAAE